MKSNNTAASTTAQALAENDAWRLVCTRERGDCYYSKTEMANRAGVEIDMSDWWTARMASMPTATMPCAASAAPGLTAI
jgi:hypothetical protein